MLICYTCKLKKDFQDFYKNSSKKSGYQSSCKECKKLYNANNYKENRDKTIERSKEYKRVNKFKILSKMYNISEEEVEGLFSSQETCQICNKNTPLVIDHCHSTGEVRGLLCNNCNVGLGLFGDENSEILDKIKSVIKYLS